MVDPNQTPPAAADRDAFLQTAIACGRRLAASAQWEGEACTWTVMSPDRANPKNRTAIPTPAGGAVYEGTAGIALFLIDLHHATGEESFLKTARGAVEFALKEAAGMPEPNTAYHSGRAGIAYTAARLGEALGDPGYYARAEETIRPIVGNEHRDMGMDVIAGAGGAIPALLQLTRWVDPELCVGMARKLGDHLMNIAVKETIGWSWGTIRSTAVRNLCGYAHGAAGIGHGLLELYAYTGEGAYRYAAEQAFLYERSFYMPEVSNWPDLRHNVLSEYQYEGRLEELRDKLLGGEVIETPERRAMSAWCHGGPGIGLSRLRAWQLLGDDIYLQEARAAIAATNDSLLEDARWNYSLCHGAGGNAETVLYAADVLGEPELRQPAIDAAVAGIEKYEATGRPWACGTLSGANDPGLLLGEAGIGSFFLRLARPDIPSPIFVTSPSTAGMDGGRAGQEGWKAARFGSIAEHFDRTLRLFSALGEDAAALTGGLPEMGPAPLRPDPELLFEAVEALIAGQADPARGELLADAFTVDRARYELARSVEDWTTEFTEGLVRRGPGELDVREGRVGLNARARVVSTRHDWDAWAEREEGGAPPEEGDTYYLVQFNAGRSTVRRLSPFAALILQSVQAPATVDDVLDQVEEALSGATRPDRGLLEDRVVEQLNQAYRAGFLVHHQQEMVPAAA
ncbi:MAG TPA: lanthionine synthetase LanC family protein [Longimicrobium sp.]|nr:lanthionine synthetase LanC family protein [Longimicrobium sp.]